MVFTCFSKYISTVEIWMCWQDDFFILSLTHHIHNILTHLQTCMGISILDEDPFNFIAQYSNLLSDVIKKEQDLIQLYAEVHKKKNNGVHCIPFDPCNRCCPKYYAKSSSCFKVCIILGYKFSLSCSLQTRHLLFQKQLFTSGWNIFSPVDA